MATVGISVCAEITRKVSPPRSLLVPFPFGSPLGAPDDPGLQRRIFLAALDLLLYPGPPPVLVEGPAG